MNLYLIDADQLATLKRVATRLHSEDRLVGDEMRDLGHALESIASVASQFNVSHADVTNDKRRVVVCNPGQAPVARSIEDNLEAMQGVVLGMIQKVPLYGTALDDFDVYVNENGHYEGLPFNRELGGHVLMGPIVVSKADADGNQVSLTPSEVERVLEALSRRGATSR